MPRDLIRPLAFVRRLSAAILLCAAPLAAQSQSFIIVQSTTSTQNSGLYDHLLPKFREATDIEARVVAVGTGQAIKNARNCDGDVLLTHAKAAEQKFVTDGYGIKREDVMYNDFVIVGPSADPAGLGAARDAHAAFRALAAGDAPFASRGDDSGTHMKEMALWRAAGLDPTGQSGGWYRETGSGMGATLNVATSMGAYAMTDRATWIAFANKGDHRILFEGDDALLNQYGVIAVSPARCPNVKADLAEQFFRWILSDEGQGRIAGYRRNGQQLFFPNGPARY